MNLAVLNVAAPVHFFKSQSPEPVVILSIKIIFKSALEYAEDFYLHWHYKKWAADDFL